MRYFVDTNVLVTLAIRETPRHAEVRSVFSAWQAARTPWCLGWNIVYEFLRVSTHSSIFPHPLASAQAEQFLFAAIDASDAVIIAPSERHAEVHRQTVRELGKPAGNLFHDIHSAVLMREHGVSEIVTFDRDFRRFPFLKVVEPLRARH